MKRETMRILTISGLAALGMSGTAAAQSACGDSYTIRPGDTLYEVSQRCRVGLTRIYQLNSGIEARNLAIGQEIRLTGNAGGGRQPDRYRVKSGDTAFSIAQTLGVSLIELLRANEDMNPLRLMVGDVLDVPGIDRTPAFRVRPREGAPGSDVRIRAHELRPGDWVTIGVGPSSANWYPLEDVQVSDTGRVATKVEVPAWADPGDVLTFVIDTDRGVTLRSNDFQVIDRAGAGDGRVALEGRIREGAECFTLRTPDGELYAVVSTDIPFTDGEYVEVEGRFADVSFCQQGRGTVQVTSLREVRPRRN
ncbi:LysM peptidoglycan-binding domain-containing protein [Halovulum marinum]|nr:LysM peptidoglycan-binding domain-containing protein [Halovulum marinum]